METKQSCRKKLLRLRDEIPAELRGVYSKQICANIRKSKVYAEAQQVFLYAAIRSEVDLQALAEAVLTDGKALFFPKTMGKEMEFYEIRDLSELKEGNFHVPEPEKNGEPGVPTEKTLICVPGCGFTPEGDRMGYGAGFYDRYFRRYPKGIKMGIAFFTQMQLRWETDAFDIPMDLVMNEESEY